jgi:arabinose-5-phosphate isomerase
VRELIQVFDIQIAALQRTKGLIGKQLQCAIEILKNCKGKIIITGIGKSGHIGHKISATLASTGSPSVFINSNEALHGDLGIIARGDVVIMLSKSGTTAELIKMLPKIKSEGIKTIGIFGKSETHLAGNLDLILDASVEEEGSPFNLAPMASTTVSLVIGDALAAGLMLAKGLKESDFANNHPAGQLGRNLLLSAADIMHEGEKMPVCKPDHTIKEAIVNLTKKNLGGLCVIAENGDFEGFVTDGDIRKYLSANDNLQISVSEIMTRKPIAAFPEMKLGQVLDLMENPKKQIYVAPVLDPVSGKALGIIRMHDILKES